LGRGRKKGLSVEALSGETPAEIRGRDNKTIGSKKKKRERRETKICNQTFLRRGNDSD